MLKKTAVMAVLLALVAMSLVPPVLAIDGAPAISVDNSKDTETTVNPEGAGQWPVPGDPILQSRFGVNLALQAGTGAFPNSFNLATFAPTANVDTVDWVQDDWYGDWSTADFTIGTTQWGTVPSGGEWYDVEAIYFDNDQENLYIAIVTSVPHLTDYFGPPAGVGVHETRGGNDAWMRPGDLSIDLGLNDPRAGWSYDYGVDIVHDDRDTLDPNGSVGMIDDALGNLMYRTANDTGTADNPTDSDWYTSAPGYNVDANYEHTNFDPSSAISGGLSPLGGTTVDYYELDFAGALENGTPTFVIEVTIPRDNFGANDPGHGDTVGIRWVEGCRNDATGTTAVIYLEGKVDDIETGDAPDSTNHFGIDNRYTDDPAETSFGYFPTVSDPNLAGNDPYGMCHVVCPTCAYLGPDVSAERDADLVPDMDIPPYPFTNITPPLLSNGDTDDGLLLPVDWQDGAEVNLTYYATLPTDGDPDPDRYVNIWFDWNRDGDWADDSVVCYNDHSQSEWVVVNDVVDFTSVGTVQVDVPFIPCNPTGEEVRIWVRITMSDQPLDDTVHQDGRGLGYCYDEGETEDYLTYAPPPLVIDLASFGAKPAGGGILVEWETATEIDNLGFNLYRSEAVDGPRVQLNAGLIPSAVAPGSLVGASYSLLDTDIARGTTYHYWLEDVDIHGVATLHGPESATAPIIRLSNSVRRIAPALGR